MRVLLRSRLVDVDALLLAGDLGLGAEAGGVAAVGVGAEAVQLEGELDGLGDALDGQVADDGPVGTVGADLGRAERHVGVVAHVEDRKSTRLNSSHANISYAVFCLKKKKEHIDH